MAGGLYIHIPFCVSKCNYCDFASYAGCADMIGPYLKALRREAENRKNDLKPSTLYIGGGTPSFLNTAQIKFLCGIIEDNFGAIKNFKESTFECNPESITEDKLKLLKSAGFNRLSIGMQTMADKHLKTIGRAHNKAQFLKAFKTAQKYFDNISVDIIAALPGQNLADFKDTIAQVVALGPAHLSVYGLQVEEGTPLYKSGFIADDNLCRAMLEHAAQYLEKSGYRQYEISNFAKRGKQSRHNINYWRGGQYLGLGAAAASYINGVRSVNTEDLKIYISGKNPTENNERLRGKAKLGEKVILGLRMIAGVRLTKQIQNSFGASIKKLIEGGLLAQTKNNIHLTKEGKYLANEVWRNFVEPF